MASATNHQWNQPARDLPKIIRCREVLAFPFPGSSGVCFKLGEDLLGLVRLGEMLRTVAAQGLLFGLGVGALQAPCIVSRVALNEFALALVAASVLDVNLLAHFGGDDSLECACQLGGLIKPVSELRT